ncbi:hypothetical protein ACLOJK_023091 [Asimina triloba]
MHMECVMHCTLAISPLKLHSDTLLCVCVQVGYGIRLPRNLGWADVGCCLMNGIRSLPDERPMLLLAGFRQSIAHRGPPNWVFPSVDAVDDVRPWRIAAE